MLNHRLALHLAGTVLLAGSFLCAGPAEDMLAKATKSVDGLVAMCDQAKNTPPAQNGRRPTLDPVAFEALCLAFDGVPFITKPGSLFMLEHKSAPSQAMLKVRKKYLLPEADEFLPRLLTHASPAVRAYAVVLLDGGLFGKSEKSFEFIKPLLTSEKEPGVLASISRIFARNAANHPEIADFILRQLNHENALLREVTVSSFCNFHENAKLTKIAEKLAELIAKEPNHDTRQTVCNYVGQLGNEIFIDPLVAVINGNDEVLRARAIKSLINLWYCFPLFRNTSEAAYRQTLKILPEVAKLPGKRHAYMSTSLGELSRKSTIKKTRDAYAAAAPWFKPEEVRAALIPFIHAETFSPAVVQGVIRTIYAHGATKAEIQAEIDKFKAAGHKAHEINMLQKQVDRLK